MHKLGYTVDFEAILNKVLSGFYTLDNLKVAAQFISDAIIAAYEANCSLKPKNISIRVSWWNIEFSEHKLQMRKWSKQLK